MIWLPPACILGRTSQTLYVALCEYHALCLFLATSKCQL